MAYADKKDASRYQNRWISEKYDRVNLTIPKGQKAVLQAYVELCGTSVNRFIWETVMEKMEQNPALLDLAIEKVLREQTEREAALLEELNNQE